MESIYKNLIKASIWACLLISGAYSDIQAKGYLNIKNCSKEPAVIIYYPTKKWLKNELSVSDEALGKPMMIKLEPNEQTGRHTTGDIRLWPNDEVKYFVAALGSNQFPEGRDEVANNKIETLDNKLEKNEIDLSKIDLSQDNRIFVVIKPETETWYTGLTGEGDSLLKGEIVDYNTFQNACSLIK